MKKKTKEVMLIFLSAAAITACGCAGKTDTGGTKPDGAAEAGSEETAVSADSAVSSDSGEEDGESEAESAVTDSGAEVIPDTVEENGASPDNDTENKENDTEDVTGESEEGASEESSEGENATAEMTDYFISQVAKAAGAEPANVRYFDVNDYDGDGHYEAFMFVGGEVDEDWGSADGTIWYANDTECKQIHEEFSFAVFDGAMFSTITAGDRKLILFNEMYATSYVTNIYTVKNSDCVETNVSGVGSAAYDESTGDMSISISAYDSYCDYEAGSEEPMWTGHTWKPYYFYFDEASEEFKEYVGETISESELTEICGFDLAKEIRDSGYTVDSIYKRENGIVNVNYSKEDVADDGSRSITFKNANFDQRTGEFIDAWGTGDTGYEASDFGGTYYPFI